MQMPSTGRKLMCCTGGEKARHGRHCGDGRAVLPGRGELPAHRLSVISQEYRPSVARAPAASPSQREARSLDFHIKSLDGKMLVIHSFFFSMFGPGAAGLELCVETC